MCFSQTCPVEIVVWDCCVDCCVIVVWLLCGNSHAILQFNCLHTFSQWNGPSFACCELVVGLLCGNFVGMARIACLVANSLCAIEASEGLLQMAACCCLLPPAGCRWLVPEPATCRRFATARGRSKLPKRTTLHTTIERRFFGCLLLLDCLVYNFGP